MGMIPRTESRLVRTQSVVAAAQPTTTDAPERSAGGANAGRRTIARSAMRSPARAARKNPNRVSECAAILS